MSVLRCLFELNLGHGAAETLLDMYTSVVAKYLLAVYLTEQLGMGFAHINDEPYLVY